MSDMKRCDRCGNQFDTAEAKHGDGFTVPMQVGEKFYGSKPKWADWIDLCHECTRSWDEWLRSGKEKGDE